MVGILIITHGNLGHSLADCARHVLQREPDNLCVLEVDKNDDPDTKLGEARRLVEQLEHGDGVVILTDMFGGTPSNLAISVMTGNGIEVIAGVNLPMLIKLASVREEKTLDEAVTSAQDAGRKYITVASRVLAGK